MRQEADIKFPQISAFNFQLTFAETTPETAYENFLHIHNKCEIYINLTGDVAFIVEDFIYPISSGSIVITRPYENHHCIYKSDAPHKHFCMFFDCKGNEHLFDIFFNRPAGQNNLLVLSEENTLLLNNICLSILNSDDVSLNLSSFFRIISLLNLGKAPEYSNHSLSSSIIDTISKINSNLSSDLKVSELAEDAHMSINTFERHFKKSIGASPYAYITRQRISHAAKLLLQGSSVREASEKSGFSDYSHFIALFKKHYTVTPLKFKNSALSQHYMKEPPQL